MYPTTKSSFLVKMLHKSLQQLLVKITQQDRLGMTLLVAARLVD